VVSRRLVVVLFLDLVGWTRLAERVDPEPLQLLLEQYYEICCAAVEEHGGVVEKFIGDAVMAVFGAATSQEDDALRALRTAFQISADVGGLRTPGAGALPVEIHCGIAAGEALVTRSARAGIRVVGDVVNLAARLQSTATAGEIMVNEIVGHLARPHFTMVPVAPVTVKGKAEPVRALLATGPAVAGRVADGSRMVDRSSERARLREGYDRVARDRQSQLVAVLGPPGIGKTRLVRETVDELGAAGAAPTAVFGSCPSYGPNGSYVALVQVLDALTRQSSPSRELVLANSHVAAILTSLRNASLSRGDGTGPQPGVEEVSWVAREVFAAAAARPLVVVWDDLERAGPTLLRLIGELTDSLRDFPLLMVCVARPELADRDFPWFRGLLDRDVIAVDGLAPADSAQLVAALAAGSASAEVHAHDLDLFDRVTTYSAGNPLFIRLMLEWATPGRRLDEVPATITAMVGAMLDRLPAPAQQLLGAASVIGPTFTVEQLALLGETKPATSIGALTQRQLIRATTEAGGYCFVQQPVHEVAYGRLDKEQRFAWHRRLAERDVSPAFHFEAAVRLLTDLRPDDVDLPRLSQHAAEGLLREGTAALRQRDVPAAIGLLDRALRLVPSGHDQSRSVAAIRLSDALMLSRDTQRAVDLVTELARQSSEGRVQRLYLMQQYLLAVRLGRIPGVAVENLLAELEGDRGDHLTWCRFEQLRMLLHLGFGRFGAAEQSARAALEHARAIGDVYEEDRLLAALCEVRQWSPTPVAERLSGCAELAERFANDRYLLVPVLTARARCLALTGDPAGARSALAEAGAAVEQLRLTTGQVLVDQAAGLACSLEGAHVEAERHFRGAADALEQAGYGPVALTLRVQAARERARQDPTSGAAEIARLLERRDQMDVRGRLLCMSAAVRLAAGDGVTVGDVLALLDTTDDPCLRGEVYFDLARAHRQLGNHADATLAAEAATDCYGAVGATKPLRTAQAWM
jgi:class 3 adenylate cyclase/tetratricopeptide (TPR) repeat protein